MRRSALLRQKQTMKFRDNVKCPRFTPPLLSFKAKNNLKVKKKSSLTFLQAITEIPFHLDH